jgi:quercetin dioxygenase-like cupin family protein
VEASAPFKTEDQKMNKVAWVLSLAVCVSIASSGALAGTGKARTLIVKELPDFPGKDGMVEVVDFAPGEVSQPHRHNADLFVYVLEGTVETQVEGQAALNLKVGDVFYESPTDVHVVSRNTSTTKPARLLVFYVKNKGAPPTVLVPHDHK